MVTRSATSSFFGDVDRVRYAASVGEGEVVVEHHDLPRAATLLMPDRVILDRAQASLIAHARGSVRSRRPLTWQGHSGREITIETPRTPPVLERVRFVLVRSRLYMVVASWPAPSEIPSAFTRFLDSFEITE